MGDDYSMGTRFPPGAVTSSLANFVTDATNALPFVTFNTLPPVICKVGGRQNSCMMLPACLWLHADVSACAAMDNTSCGCKIMEHLTPHYFCKQHHSPGRFRPYPIS